MNIIACVKRVPTTDAEVRFKADSSGLETDGLPYMISFYDEIALEQAVLTKESLGGEVTALTLGPADGSKEIRECLAKGADKAVVLTDDQWMTSDCRATAKRLAAAIGEIDAQLVFMGRVATDRDNAAVGPMCATYLGWACVSGVIEIDCGETHGSAKVETEEGVETVEFTLPAVITCNKGLNTPRYAGLKGIMAAKKKPMEEQSPANVGGQAVVNNVCAPPARPEGRIVGTGAEAVPALIDALRNEAQVL